MGRVQLIVPDPSLCLNLATRVPSSFWLNSLLAPFYFICISASLLGLEVTVNILRRLKKSNPSTTAPHPDEDDSTPPTLERAEERVSRDIDKNVQDPNPNDALLLIVSIALAGLTAFNLPRHDTASNTRNPTQCLHNLQTLPSTLLSLAPVISSIYASCLAAFSVFSRSAYIRRTSAHLRLVLAVLLAVYVYRDVWPLATYTLHPQDSNEGLILPLKIALLVLGAIVIPLSTDRQYTPVDPRQPMEKPNPEQTSSWFSIIVYSFMDSIIWRASRVPHLPYEELPALPDYDHANNLVKRSYPYVDRFSGAKKKHLLWGLLDFFRSTDIKLVILQLCMVLTNFVRPLGINGILRYLETDGQDSYLRPWAWLICLFLGPLLHSIVFQLYIFFNNAVIVRCEGILIQLIFDHALRIRVNGTERQSREADAPNGKGKSKGNNLVGKLNNLATSDVANITVPGRDYLYIVLNVPVQFALAMYYLYHFLGWSSFVGLGVMLITFPLPGFILKRMRAVQAQYMRKTDARVQSITEMLNVLRMVKLFGWERKVHNDVEAKREAELSLVWKVKLLELAHNIINYVLPLAQMISTYLTFTIIMKKPLSASLVFSTISVFDIVRFLLTNHIGQLPMYIQAFTSLDRVHKFLTETELLDRFSDQTSVERREEESADIIIREAVFTWSAHPDEEHEHFKLLVEQELRFQPGVINLILGPTGSGKTSLLMALLSEMHYEPRTPSSLVNLPRKGGVAYAAQESWVQNATIRDNILFGSPYDEDRYNKVIHGCALAQDLSLFADGDHTEVGEKGLTLSGGQKARVTLARAVYSRAAVVLLDDILAALDVHTAKWVVEKCLKGELLRGRTVLLVTHNVALARPVAEFTVSLSADGRVLSQGSVTDALNKSEILAKEVVDDEAARAEAERPTAESVPLPSKDAKPERSAGKLVAAEEIAVGHVGWDAVKMYLSSLGGNQALVYWTLMLSAQLVSQLATASQAWYLGQWAHQYDLKEPSDVKAGHYFSVYTLLVAGAVIVNAVYFGMFTFGQLRASRKLHHRLLESVLGATWRWLDITPSARIIARCTQDIRSVDASMSNLLSRLIAQTLSMIVKLAAVAVFIPVIIIPGVLLAAVGAFIGQIYMKAQLNVRREMSVARAPILSHFGAAMNGLVSIRAYNAEAAFHQESLRRIDRYSRSAKTFSNITRWFNFRINFLGNIFTTSLAAYLVYGRNLSTASDTGFSLVMAVGFSEMLLWWIRMLNDFEVNGNSLERIKAYTSIENERKSTPEGQPPAYWPSSGKLQVNNLSARYSVDGPDVLKDVSFAVQSGERVGIVGRTGSGKSSLTLALLGCIPTTGEIYYDNLSTSSVNLDVLRSNVTIIPQAPELVSGTLRRNLDPFGQHDDVTLIDALRSSGFFASDEMPAGQRINLDSQIASGGTNISFGQRQILAMARALIRNSKLLILDEATSGIDHATDNHIQQTLRNELGKDVTVITVAHRLHTIMASDKIIVLDAGRIVETGKPAALLAQKDGLFKALVDESGDKDALYALAEESS